MPCFSFAAPPSVAGSLAGGDAAVQFVGEAQRVFQARDLPRSRLAAGARPYDGLEHGAVAEDVFGFERGHDADDEKCDASSDEGHLQKTTSSLVMW